MKTLCCCIVAAILTLAGSALRAEDKPKTQVPKPGADGWISLFNGKDLSEWEGMEGYWSVVEGAIQCSETKENSKQTDLISLYTKDNPEKFANFELRYSWRMVTKTGNSGVQFRSQIDNPKMLHVGGYQADIDADNNYTGIIYCEGAVAGGRGIMSKRGEKTVWDENNKRSATPMDKSDAEIKKAIKPCGEWNDCVVVADGNRIVYSINGQVTTEMTDNSPKACKDGVIAFQMHGGFTMTIQFKDVKVKMLPEKK
jgi:hypothetical protein